MRRRRMRSKTGRKRKKMCIENINDKKKIIIKIKNI